MDLSQATPAKHFDFPPYRAELFSQRSGWAGVMNANGVNCLTFKSKPGEVVTSMEHAIQIATLWNTHQ